MRAASFATSAAVACVLLLSHHAIAETCRAQNILTACLNMQNLQFKKCEYDEWQCKCHAQKKILTCYDNCPDSENRTLQEMQVQIYCAAVNGKEYNSELIDRMTRPAKIVADEEQPTHAPEAKKSSQQKKQQPAPAPAQTTNDKKLNDEPLLKAGGGGGGRDNFSVLNSAFMNTNVGLLSSAALIIAAVLSNFV